MKPLVPHPSTPELAAEVAASMTRVATGQLRFSYRLVGVGIDVPSAAPCRRADALWTHTCFEAFVTVGDGPAYIELNFSPSGEWAAYAFEGYREGAKDFAVEPAIVVRRRDGTIELDATLDLAPPRRVGLMAVVEMVDGRVSCWALRHPSAKPDFHDPGGWEDV
jgi:hypothetical protein